MELNLLPTIQQAISSLLLTYEPEFLRFGHRLFLSLATIILAWHGIQMMFAREGLSDSMFEFAKLLLVVALGYSFIAFYESPLPGIGVSFSNLITDQAFYFQSVLEARSFDNIYRHFDELSDRFIQPDAWAILANLIYWIVLLLVAFAKAVSMAVIAFGLIASAVCALLGPLFVPFFIVPKLDWLFWGWFKAFIQYSFIPVVAIAFLMVFEQFVFR
jgi:type IV secretory pathway VirB6-like protein